MPYNNTPIAPSQEVSGQVSLPLARVQKIINADAERPHVSKNAAFAIALATEMFIQHMAVTTHNVVKAERKPRRNIQYRDVASAVAKTDNLEFLVDVVPRTMTYREYKQKVAASGKGVGKTSEAVGTETVLVAEGTATTAPLNGNGSIEKEVQEPADKMELDGDVTESGPEEDDEDGAAMQLEMEMRGGRANGTGPVAERRTSGIAEANGTS
ncbi:uncharacterized protein EI97DRAFT_431281 [Westerdykella ornata]|uniref:Transcription factor CBF/NF-Y/archaeal histone domain-containing protein n=1 Tax=Westerdykella ornata TaxID=318751 RepID=A0A6A6JR85_WESOR|nr:uncharacterized protein EI97DRAFT_431281 [Westerdykella ornata]KAF2279062.1 hypothetical protein EI97DRAFT_431281 [Westerdykella ornata]